MLVHKALFRSAIKTGRGMIRHSKLHTGTSPSTSEPPSLRSQHETFTTGHNYWRDNLHLSLWQDSKQAVVYQGDVFNNYELKLRLGDWCWLTKHRLSGCVSLPSTTRVATDYGLG